MRGYVDLGVEEGAKLVVDGRGLSVAGHEDGYFLGGCLFDRVTPQMRIYREEIFGPVLCVVRVRLRKRPCGSSTSTSTATAPASSPATAKRRVTSPTTSRSAWWASTCRCPCRSRIHSFGGWKRSLFGDLYAYGPDGVRFYTRRKTITQRWPAGGVREQAQFAFPSL